MSQIYITSDTHFHHKNICRGTSQWQEREEGGSHQSTRNFKSLEDMNAAIVKGINSKVKHDDVLYHLGDWNFGGLDQMWNFRKQITCNTIHLIFGNHDQHIEANKILPNVFRDTNNFLQDATELYKGTRGIVKARELFTSTSYVKTIKAGGQTIFLSHYAHRVWDKSHHGRIHLYGHSHSTLEDNPHGKSMDVGIDNYYRLYGKYEPFSLPQILDIMAKREAKIIDHHNQKTN